MAQFTVALDGDRPTEITLTFVISPAKNNRGKPRAGVAVEFGKAKRRGKPAADPETQPVARGPLARRKST